MGVDCEARWSDEGFRDQPAVLDRVVAEHAEGTFEDLVEKHYRLKGIPLQDALGERPARMQVAIPDVVHLDKELLMRFRE